MKTSIRHVYSTLGGVADRPLVTSGSSQRTNGCVDAGLIRAVMPVERRFPREAVNTISNRAMGSHSAPPDRRIWLHGARLLQTLQRPGCIRRHPARDRCAGTTFHDMV